MIRNRYGEVVDVAFERELRELLAGSVEEAALGSEARVSMMYEDYKYSIECNDSRIIAEACSEMEGRITIGMDANRSMRLKRRRSLQGDL